MAQLHVDVNLKGNTKNGDNVRTADDIEECDFSKLLDKPRPLNIDRQRSCDERSLNELSIGLSPHLSCRNSDAFSRIIDHIDYVHSPIAGRKSGFNTPRSHVNVFEPHPTVAEAWDALRRSLVYFRGQPVGTIAALDNSEEELNYDQVKSLNLIIFQSAMYKFILFCYCHSVSFVSGLGVRCWC